MLFNNVVLRCINTLLDTPVFYVFYRSFITTFKLFITTFITKFIKATNILSELKFLNYNNSNKENGIDFILYSSFISEENFENRKGFDL